MRDFVLMTDSCCDMAPQMAEELGLIVLPLSLELGLSGTGAAGIPVRPAKAGRKISGGTAGLRRKYQGTHLPLVYGG